MSSSKIRNLLAQGKVNLARRMLGRPYGVEGRVERGNERGHTLGFPTANLRPQNRVIPANGVYVTGSLIDGQWRRSVTNVGTRPTFETGSEPSVETFVINWMVPLRRCDSSAFLYRCVTSGSLTRWNRENSDWQGRGPGPELLRACRRQTHALNSLKWC